MKITKISPVTGKENSMNLDITEEQILDYASGTHAQDAFPNLNDDEREFMISGCTKEDFDFLFGEEEEDNFDYDEAAF